MMEQRQLHAAPLKQRGPADIVKRLKIGLEPLASYENFPGLMVDNGCDVMYEHHEEWHWASGESAVLKFVSVHRVVDGRITLWKDYWDMGALSNHAPGSWLADFATADMSWVFDATGGNLTTADVAPDGFTINLAISLFLGLSGGGGVAHFAHLGGMVGGWLMLRYWRGQRGRRR